MKIAIAGTGYVGLSNAILLSQHHKVTAVDVIQEKVDMVNRKESPIVDDYIEDYLAHKDLDLTATMDGDSAYRDADLIVIATSTHRPSKPSSPRSSASAPRPSSSSNPPSRSDTPRKFPPSILTFPFSSRRNSSVKAKLSTTTSTRPASSSGSRKEKKPSAPKQKNFQPWNRKALSARTSRSSSQDLLKQSPSNSSPTPSSPSALPTSMKSTPMPKKRA